MPSSETTNANALKLRKLIGEGKSLETPVSLYLRNECGYVPDGRAAPYLLRHTMLPDYAHGGGFYPALVVHATNQATGMEAAEIIYLTFEGALAPLPAPRLLIGAAAGASVVVQQGGRDGRTVITERVEDALRLARSCDDRTTLIAALRCSNILNLPQLADLSGAGDVLLYARHGDFTAGRQAKWLDVADALRRQGLHAGFYQDAYTFDEMACDELACGEMACDALACDEIAGDGDAP